MILQHIKPELRYSLFIFNFSAIKVFSFRFFLLFWSQRWFELLMLLVENFICVWRRINFSRYQLWSKLIKRIFKGIELDFNFSSSSFKFIWQFYSLVLMMKQLTDNIFKILNHFCKGSGSLRMLLASLCSNSNSSLFVSVIFFILIWLNSQKLKKKS